MRKIVIMTDLEERHIDQIREIIPDWDVIVSEDQAVYEPHLADAEIITATDRDFVALGLIQKPALRWFHTWAAGVEFMPFAELKNRGIRLTNSGGVHPVPITENIFGLMLAWTRKISAAIRNQVEQKWVRWDAINEISGKTIAILGVGNIGAETARIAKAFNMTVLGIRRTGDAMPFVDEMHVLTDLDAVLGRSDYVVNILPKTADTSRIMNRDRFAAMKPDAFYISVGRGSTTDTDALVEALTNQQIGGAGLDVMDPEPLPAGHPLWDLENVIITPHISGSSVHYFDRAVEIFAENLRAYVKDGSIVRNEVDLEKGY